METLWSKKNLPVDWNVEYASLETIPQDDEGQYVHETYKYVASSYDGNKWHHHLALIMAIFITTILPEVFYPDQDKAELYKNIGTAAVTQMMRNLPWAKTKTISHKGVTAPRPYITMLTTAIIAVFEEQSPLRQYAKVHKNAFGQPWTGKHGEPDACII